jgi:hypothetical protein
MKNSLNFVRTCLKVLDTRRIVSHVTRKSLMRLPFDRVSRKSSACFPLTICKTKS